jgi:hypothetical protein
MTDSELNQYVVVKLLTLGIRSTHFYLGCRDSLPTGLRGKLAMDVKAKILRNIGPVREELFHHGSIRQKYMNPKMIYD